LSGLNFVKKGRILAVIPSYNSREHIAEAISSLFNQDYPDLRILVIDDCSTDGTYEFLQKSNDKVTVVKNEVNLGISGTLNKALSFLQGEEFFLVLSDDCELVGDNWVTTAIRHFKKETVGVVCGEIFKGNLDSLPLIKRIFAYHKEASGVTAPGNKVEEVNISWLWADLFRSAVLKKIGGFCSAKGRKYGVEDNITSYRIRSSGYVILKDTSLLVTSSWGRADSLYQNLRKEILIGKSTGWAIAKGMAETKVTESEQLARKLRKRKLQIFLFSVSCVLLMSSVFSLIPLITLVIIQTLRVVYFMTRANGFRGIEKLYFAATGSMLDWLYPPNFIIGFLEGFITKRTSHRS
jgi:glycosyltransferase involved in cell wall biosynthesis